jgi:hypothetical protein
MPPAQVRLHAVAVCDALFARSRAFRGHVAAQFPAFLELAVGHRPARPLPGPARLSTQLRERALDAIEAWNEAHGVFYQQARGRPAGSKCGTDLYGQSCGNSNRSPCDGDDACMLQERSASCRAGSLHAVGTGDGACCRSQRSAGLTACMLQGEGSHMLQESAAAYAEANSAYWVWCAQIRLGVRYLKDVLKMQFPELRARAAAVEAEARRRQVLLPHTASF